MKIFLLCAIILLCPILSVHIFAGEIEMGFPIKHVFINTETLTLHSCSNIEGGNQQQACFDDENGGGFCAPLPTDISCNKLKLKQKYIVTLRSYQHRNLGTQRQVIDKISPIQN